MIPVKSKDLTANTALALDRPKEEIDAVCKFFWKTVRETLTTLPTLRVAIPNLGTFTTIPGALNQKIEKTEQRMQKFDDGTTIRMEYERQLSLLQAQKQRMLLEQERKQKVKKLRTKDA